ncbi:MAG: hypothetical protein ABEJ35_05190 [Halobacteriaceae archaeon]
MSLLGLALGFGLPLENRPDLSGAPRFGARRGSPLAVVGGVLDVRGGLVSHSTPPLLTGVLAMLMLARLLVELTLTIATVASLLFAAATPDGSSRPRAADADFGSSAE